jgi:hypothetical protein
MVAAKMATLRNGQHGKAKAEQKCSASVDAAELLSVSRRSVMAAKHVLDNGSPALIKAAWEVKPQSTLSTVGDILCP